MFRPSFKTFTSSSCRESWTLTQSALPKWFKSHGRKLLLRLVAPGFVFKESGRRARFRSIQVVYLIKITQRNQAISYLFYSYFLILFIKYLHSYGFVQINKVSNERRYKHGQGWRNYVMNGLFENRSNSLYADIGERTNTRTCTLSADCIQPRCFICTIFTPHFPLPATVT